MKKLILIIAFLIPFQVFGKVTDHVKSYRSMRLALQVKMIEEALPHIEFPDIRIDDKIKLRSNNGVKSENIIGWHSFGLIYLRSNANIYHATHEIGHAFFNNSEWPHCEVLATEYAIKSYPYTGFLEDKAEYFVLYMFGGERLRRLAKYDDCVRKKYDIIKGTIKKEYNGWHWGGYNSGAPE